MLGTATAHPGVPGAAGDLPRPARRAHGLGAAQAALGARLEDVRHQLRQVAANPAGARALAARIYGVWPVAALAMTCWLAGTAGGCGDLRGVGEGLPGEDGQQRLCCPDQGGVAGAGGGAGQCLQGGVNRQRGSAPRQASACTRRAVMAVRSSPLPAACTADAGTGRAGGGAPAGACPRGGWAGIGVLAGIAAWTVGKVARCRPMPVTSKTLATSGAGEARRSHPPSSLARRADRWRLRTRSPTGR
jgi:hypothetical protein